MAAIDTAIDDGVDVLSMSFASPYVANFYNTGMAIGAFRAMEKGIFVSCSAGNNRPSYNTTFNEAPWILTVGASMTTADVVNRAHNPIEDETFLPASVFATGSGQVNPPAAINPGLVYDIQSIDYIPYLCGLNYTNQQVGMIINRKVDCSMVSAIRESQLNYPAFVLIFADEPIGSSQKYTRTVTNVGEARSTYKVSIVSPPGFEVHVNPKELGFTKLKQKMQYEVTFKRVGSRADDEKPYVEGYFKWDHCGKKYSVRSPIAIILVN